MVCKMQYRYNPDMEILNSNEYVDLTCSWDRAPITVKNMQSEDHVSDMLREHTLLKHLDWDKGNLVLAGGYVSRLLCGDSLEGSDIDLFLYGKYDRRDIRDIASWIYFVYGECKWYRAGSVLVAKAKNAEIQIMCTNHQSKEDILSVFDASYVQCGWDGTQLFVLPDFNKYTRSGLAKVTRPTCSIHRDNKAVKRGFLPVLRRGQRVIWIVKNPMNLKYMTPLHKDIAISEVGIYGDFNPYIENDYYSLSNTKYERCMVDIETSDNIVTIKENEKVLFIYMIEKPYIQKNPPVVAIKGDSIIDVHSLSGAYPAYKLINTDSDCIQMRIVADEGFYHDNNELVTFAIGNTSYSMPRSQLSQHQL